MTRYLLLPKKTPSAFRQKDKPTDLLSSDREGLVEETRELRATDSVVEPIHKALEGSRALGFNVISEGTAKGSYFRFSVIEGGEAEKDVLTEQFSDFVLVEDVAMTPIRPNAPPKRAAHVPTSRSEPWHLIALNIFDLQEQWPDLDGRGVNVAVIDSGIERVPDLDGVVAASYEYDFDQDIMTPNCGHDTETHGTFTAGLIAGTRTGVAPGAQLTDLLAVPDGEIPYFGTYLRSIEFVVAHKLSRIINISAGLSYYPPELHPPIMDVWDANILTIAAIGNDGESNTLSPGNFRELLGVGAVDSDDELYEDGSYEYFDIPGGPYSKPDFVAPGVNLTSCHPDGGYAVGSGTSFGTAVASGLAALFLSADPGMTNEELWRLLMESCRDAGHDDLMQGNGVITTNPLFSRRLIS